ncbi:MAG TPA: cytochrome c [Rhodanobacteraceae bacterium]|nr:cytochrome c [Rhodanobacteraceae bacterium]
MKRLVLRVLAVIAALVVALVAFVVIRSQLALHQRWHIDEAALVIPADPATVERGRHIAITRGCGECHGVDLGGHAIVDSPHTIGRIAAPNLTPGHGSATAAFSPADWERAIRHGIAPDGRGLLFMPILDFAGLSDADTADLIAYLEQVPPVDHEMPPSVVGPLGRVLFAFGKLPLTEARLVDHHAAHSRGMVVGPTAESGRNLVQGCIGCHGEHLSGGAVPGLPPSFPKAANLTPDPTGIGAWVKADFYRALREGRRPDGSAIDPFMPWKALGHFYDVELVALWAYLRSLPARPHGQR